MVHVGGTVTATAAVEGTTIDIVAATLGTLTVVTLTWLIRALTTGFAGGTGGALRVGILGVDPHTEVEVSTAIRSSARHPAVYRRLQALEGGSGRSPSLEG